MPPPSMRHNTMNIYTKVVYRFQVTSHEFNHILNALQTVGGEREMDLADELIRRRDNFRDEFIRSFQLELRQREVDDTETVELNEKEEPVIVKKANPNIKLRLKGKKPSVQ